MSFLFFCFISLALKILSSQCVIVNTTKGQVKGTLIETPISSYYGFLGIPYAKPPVGDLRFEAPVPPDSWTDVLDATSEAKYCISNTYTVTFIAEDEDCLYINVYTPSLEPEEKLPVVVWIYGGAYVSGSSIKLIYGPDFFVAQNVIMVSFNYRLGPFGFLSTGDTTIPGNNGLKDQNLALNWTKTNIENFGGDPDKITIFGESAGASSVGLHLLSDKSAGLFRAGILCSGSALPLWTVQEDPLALFSSFVSNIPLYSVYEATYGIKGALRKQSVPTLITAANAVPYTKSVFNFVPVIEKPNDSAFITQSHYELLKNGSFSQVPILIGIDAEEALVLLSTNILFYASLYDTDSTSIIPTNLNVNSANQTAAISAIRNLYLDEGSTFLGNLTAVVKYFGDNVIVRPTLKHAELHSEFAPVYLYEFNYYGGRRYLPILYVADTGNVSHTGELPYLLYSPLFYTTTETDLLVQNQMVTLWTNFIKYLDPTPTKDTDLNITWPQYNTSNSNYLYIDANLTVRSNLRSDMLSNWDRIFTKYGEEPFVTY